MEQPRSRLVRGPRSAVPSEAEASDNGRKGQGSRTSCEGLRLRAHGPSGCGDGRRPGQTRWGRGRRFHIPLGDDVLHQAGPPEEGPECPGAHGRVRPVPPRGAGIRDPAVGGEEHRCTGHRTGMLPRRRTDGDRARQEHGGQRKALGGRGVPQAGTPEHARDRMPVQTGRGPGVGERVPHGSRERGPGPGAHDGGIVRGGRQDRRGEAEDTCRDYGLTEPCCS